MKSEGVALQYVRHDQTEKKLYVRLVYNCRLYEVEADVWKIKLWKIMKDFENVESSMKKNKKNDYSVILKSPFK